MIYWDVVSSPLIDIILCICTNMRLSMSKGLTRGDRLCWDRVMFIIWARRDRPCEWLVMIISWARGDRPFWGLFHFMLVRWERPHRHVEIVRVDIWTSRVPHGSWTLDVFSRNIMYIWLRQYLESESYHFMVSFALHLITSFIFVDYEFYWWLKSMWYLISSIWWSLTGTYNIDLYT